MLASETFLLVDASMSPQGDQVAEGTTARLADVDRPFTVFRVEIRHVLD